MISVKQARAMHFAQQDGDLAVSMGTIRSGKTHSSTIGFGLYTAGLDKAYKHLVLGRKLRVIESEVLPHLEELARDLGIFYRYLRDRQEVVFGRQRFFVRAGNDKKSMDILTGFTAHSVLCDEATLVPEDFFKMAMSRMTFGDSKAWAMCNPSYPSHWLKKEWIDKGKSQLNLEFDFADNPTLDKATVARYKSQFSGVFAKRYIQGLWAAAEGLVYPDYHVAVLDTERAYTVVRSDLGVDYGTGSKTAIVLWQTLRSRVDGQVRHYIPKCWEIKGGTDRVNKSDDFISDEVIKYADAYKCKTVVLDPSALSLRTALLRKPKRKFLVRRGKNDVVPGVRIVGNALARREKPHSITIGPEATGLIEEIEGYVWGPDEKPEKSDADHYCDATRYIGMDRIDVPTGPIRKPRGF